MSTWTPDSWTRFPAAQQPEWPDPVALDARPQADRGHAAAGVRRRGRSADARISPRCASGEAFLLQAGDCAESFDARPPTRSATSCGSSCRWRSCSRTPPGLPGGEGRTHRRPVRQAPLQRHRDASTTSSCRRFGATSSTTWASAPTSRSRRPGAPARRPTTSRRPPSTCCGRSPRVASPTSTGSTPGTRSSSTRARSASATRARRRHRLAPCASCGPCGISHRGPRPAAQVDFYTSHEALLLGYEEALTRRDSHHRRLVRLLGPHAVDRRAHPPARRRPRRVPPGRPQPVGCKLGPTATRRRGHRDLRGAQPRPDPRSAHPHHPHGCRPASPRGCRPCSQRRPRCRSSRSCGRATRCTATPSRAPSGRKTRHLDDVLAETRRLLRRPPARRAPGPVASTSSSPATTSPSASAAATTSATTTSACATRPCATPGSTAASRSTSPSGWPSSSAATRRPTIVGAPLATDRHSPGRRQT